MEKEGSRNVWLLNLDKLNDNIYVVKALQHDRSKHKNHIAHCAGAIFKKKPYNFKSVSPIHNADLSS